MNKNKNEYEMRLLCEMCGWMGGQRSLLVAPNPFDQTETIHGCPLCGGIGQFRRTCDVIGCREYVCCGWLDADMVYHNTCHEHSPRRGIEDDGSK